MREYKGSHSGEHGDGIVRSEFNEPMFGARLTRAFEEVKDAVRPARPAQPRQDRASAAHGRPLACFATSRATRTRRSARTGARLVGSGAASRGAVEMCNNNGALPQVRRRHDVPVLSRHRRRAARHARPRQYAAAGAHGPARSRRVRLGRDAETHGSVRVVQGLPARMSDRRRHGADEDRVPASTARGIALTLRERLVAYLPRYAPCAARLAPLLNLRDRVPRAARPGRAAARLCRAAQPAALAQRLFARRGMPAAEARRWCCSSTPSTASSSRKCARRERVLGARGLRGAVVARRSGRPLCCGRTFLSRRPGGRRRESRRARLLPRSRLSRARARHRRARALVPAELRDEFLSLVPGAEKRPGLPGTPALRGIRRRTTGLSQ